MKDGGWLDKYQEDDELPIAQVGTNVAKTDATTVKQPAKLLLKTKEEIAREAALEKARLAAEAAKRQTYLSADTKTPELRAALREGRNRQDYINNSQLAQSLEAMSTTPGMGAIAAQTITEMNPIMSAVRLTNSLKDPANNPYGIGPNSGVVGNALGVLGVVGDVTDFGNMLSPAAKMAGSYLDQAIYPTRTYRASVPGGNPAIYEGSGDLANKVFSKGDWTTKDLRDAVQYLSGSEAEGARPGLLTGQNMNFTEYKVPFWKKSIASDPDVIALKKLQGDVPSPDEYIIPNNKFLYPRRTNTIQAVPENVKAATIENVYGEQFTPYEPGKGVLSYSDVQYSSPAYKYVEDQINAVTGQEMPYTFDFGDFKRGISSPSKMYDWQQPQFAPNAGIGKFERFGNTAIESSTPGVSSTITESAPINKEAFKDAYGFLERRQFVKDLQKKGLIGKEFGETDARYAARSTEKTNALTKLALDREATFYRGVQGSVPENGIGYQDHTGREFNMSRPAWDTEISEFENMINAGVDFNDPLSIAEYQATHVPMEQYGYRSGMPRIPNVDAIYTTRVPNTYGNYQMRMTLPRDYSEGNYSDWANKYFKPKNNLEDILVSRDYNKKDFIPNADYETPIGLSATNRSAVVGQRGQKMFEVDKTYPYMDYKNLSGDKLSQFQDFVKKLNQDYDTGFRGQYKNGGWLDKFDDGGLVQPNYNDYSVSAPEGFEGSGYFNEGRNYSPAWGGQFQKGGVVNSDDVAFEKFKATLPPNLANTPNEDYDMRYKWEHSNKPKDFAEFQGWAPGTTWDKQLPIDTEALKAGTYNTSGFGLVEDVDENTGEVSYNYHGDSVEPTTGRFLKPKHHSTLYKELEGFYNDPGMADFRRTHALKDVGNFFQYVPKEEEPAGLTFLNPKLRNMLEGYKPGFMDTVGDYRLPEGYAPPSIDKSSEISTSIGGEDGEPAYLIPTFKYGQRLNDYIGEFNMTGQHLGGPFKTVEDAEKFGKLRHEYVGKGQTLPSPIARSNMQMGGSLPGAVGFMYARTGSIPSNGKYAKKTMASAQNGMEMKYYQEGLDFQPKTISRNGSVIKDDMGQYNHPGEITEIGSNQITMQGVPYPVLGISDTGDTQMMYPDEDYIFDGESVTEYPMMKEGGGLQLTKLDQLLNFTNYNNEQPGGWLDKYEDGGTVETDETTQTTQTTQTPDQKPNISKWLPKDPYDTELDPNYVKPKVTKKKPAVVQNTNRAPAPAKPQVNVTPNRQTAKGLNFEQIPTADKKKVIIDNYSDKYDYIVEGDKTYYRVKGGKSWDDISDNKTAQKNLLQFIDKNNYWSGYASGEKDLLYPKTNTKKSTTAAPTKESSYFDNIINGTKKAITDNVINPLSNFSNVATKEVTKLKKTTSAVVDDVVNSVKSGTNKAIKSTDDLGQTIMNGVNRKLKMYTGIGADDVELVEPVSKVPKTIKEWYANSGGSSTVLDVKDQAGRQYKQQVLPTSSITFGSRNRDELKDINTEGLEITAFEPFASNKNLPDNKTVLAIDAAGKLHTGKYKDFKNKKGFKVSETVVNKIVDLPDGKYKDAPKNPGYKQPLTKTIDDNGKLVDGSINVLVKDPSKNNFYGSVQGGRILFVDPTTKEQYLVSGSAQHIRDTFKQLKGNNKYLEAYTLDNGTYARGLSYKDGKLTKERLHAYDEENTGGGNGLYIITNTKPVNKYQESYIDNMPNIRTEKSESFKRGHAVKNEIKNIILHHTAYTDAESNDRQLHQQYMTPNNNSSHVVIEEDGKRTIYASPEQVTYHAGESKWNNRSNVNDFGIGVEFQGDTNKRPLTQKQIESFVEYYTPIARKYNLSLKDIITHQMIAPGRKPDITNKEYKRILSYMKSKNFK
jgi:hypothetical protein